MSSFASLKTAIQNAIKQNGNEEITGTLLQNILLSIVETLGDTAINALETGLSSEATTRGNADTTLQTNINNEATARQNADTTLQTNIDNEATARQNADSQLNNLITGIKNNIDNGYVYAGIATPSATPVSGRVFYVAIQAGTYTNFGNIAVIQDINILKYNGSVWSKDVVIGIDDEPTAGSDNLVKSGGVQNELALGAVYDVSAKNPTAGSNNDGKWESLSALLSDANLNTLIPTAYRKGGMSIKFVQTSDNNYVQWRLVSKDWSTDTNNWVAENEDFRNEVMREVNEAIDSIQPIEITGDVTNAPDEEDLTSVNIGGTDVLKFKDKAYNPLTYSGMGRKILRKNIVEGVNTLTQDMFYKDGDNDTRIPNTNTIYVIQYDFTLDEDITIPENCVLEFDGGSLSGGNICGSKTILKGNVKIENYTGVFVNSNGLPMYDDLLDYSKLCFVRKNGVSPLDLGVAHFTANQSGLYYNGYYILFYDYGEQVLAVVCDSNFDPAGYSIIDIDSHCNGCTLKDGYIYVSGGFKVSASTLISNAIAKTGTTVEQDTWLSRYNAVAYSDLTRKWVKRDSLGYLHIYDESRNLIKDFAKNAKEYLDKYMNNYSATQSLYFDGYFVYMVGVQSGGKGSVVSIIDIDTEELVGVSHIDNSPEIEAIFARDGKLQYIAHLDSTSVLGDIMPDSNFIVRKNIYEKTSIDPMFYVDNTYTGTDVFGTSAAPFKRLSQALSLTDYLHKKRFTIKYSQNPYYLHRYLQDFDWLSFIGTVDSITGNPPTIIAELNILDSYVQLQNLNIKTVDSSWDYLMRIRRSEVIIKDCTVDSSGTDTNNNIQCDSPSKIRLSLKNVAFVGNGSNTGILESSTEGLTVLMNNVSFTDFNQGITKSENNVYEIMNGVSVSFNNVTTPVKENSTTSRLRLHCLSNQQVDDVIKYLGGSVHSAGVYGDLVIENTTTTAGESGLLYLETTVPITWEGGSYMCTNPLLRPYEANAVKLLEWNGDILSNNVYARFLRRSLGGIIFPIYGNVNVNLLTGNVIKMVNNKGQHAGLPIGDTSSRPDYLDSDDKGYEYYDKTVNKQLYWNGTAWVDATGTTV